MPFSFEDLLIVAIEEDKKDFRQEIQTLKQEIECLRVEQELIAIQQEHLQIQLEVAESKIKRWSDKNEHRKGDCT
jgi:hypothetical protein